MRADSTFPLEGLCDWRTGLVLSSLEQGYSRGVQSRAQNNPFLSCTTSLFSSAGAASGHLLLFQEPPWLDRNVLRSCQLFHLCRLLHSCYFQLHVRPKLVWPELWMAYFGWKAHSRSFQQARLSYDFSLNDVFLPRGFHMTSHLRTYANKASLTMSPPFIKI